MDKVAAGIVDKLSIIGFFNVIISGGVLLYGISPILDRYAPGIFYMNLSLEKDLEKGIILCLVCYIMGSAMQSIQALFFKGLKAGIVNKCLLGMQKTGSDLPEEGVLANRFKREDIAAMAAKLFADKNLGEFDPEDPVMCQYFFDYCEYSNSIKGYSGRADRLSESAAFYEQLTVAFYALVVIGIVYMLVARVNTWIYCLGYLAMGTVFMGRAYHCRLNWARTVLSTYEVVTDQAA